MAEPHLKTRPTVPSRASIADMLMPDETAVVRDLLDKARLPVKETTRISDLARRLVEAVRKGRRQKGGVDEFMLEYSLSSEEGVVLMCLAEALLRIPDADTADKLIADKIGGKQWDRHLGQSESLFVNASTWGLMLTGQVIELGGSATEDAPGYLKKLVARSGEPIIRQAMRHAMRIMGRQFVLGRTIDEALGIAAPLEGEGYRFSFDMLGEAAMTMHDANRYYAAYETALNNIARHAGAGGEVYSRPSLSVKLSALHPRYEERARDRAIDELLPRVQSLAKQAKMANLGLTIDAEEVDRLDLSLELFERLCLDQSLVGWDGLGLAVQAYSKRGYPVLEWLAGLAEASGRRLPVRLVKGAYWDTEIKLAQVSGFDDYPLFTRKVATDVSYLACARLMLSRDDAFYPQFATHNAHTVAAISVMAGDHGGFEFQRLHGMGQALYDAVVAKDALNQPCRIYAPVGSHEDLLAYLVRRLLENGANTSFVNRLADDDAPIDDIIADPVQRIDAMEVVRHAHIAMPRDIFAPRANSRGVPLWHGPVRDELRAGIDKNLADGFTACAIVDGKPEQGEAVQELCSPHDKAIQVGAVSDASAGQVTRALESSSAFQDEWDKTGGAQRARILERAADLYEQNTVRLMALLVREAGKTLDNALADLREAVDFLRYYAALARVQFGEPQVLPGPTGERNEISLHGRGVFACISPWNFPLAIFTGQMSAALAAGNTVITKPAEQTPLVAFEAVKLLHRAGVPGPALQLLPGDGARLGKLLLAEPSLAGVAFTGSNDTATLIHDALAARGGPIVPLIAETGGMNAMIVDSSALPEQAVQDVVWSAFDSAGQRCSAARIMFVQTDIAGRLIPMLKGAIEELRTGDPLDYATDIGPVIDEDARSVLEAHKAKMAEQAVTLIDCPLGKGTGGGTYVAPSAYQLDDISILDREVFGPILHVVTYQADRLNAVCEAINNTGYGLTLGLHTRIESTVAQVRARMRVGNMYVNRNQIGAVVGSQPFGGEGLSGTGPKAGGPHYLQRFATERVLSVDTTASGGNAALMALSPGERP